MPQLSSAFGPRGGRNHNGIDVPVSVGTPVRAVADGTVVRADSGGDGSYGLVIYVDHPDGTQSRYAHLGGANVKVGDRVTAGQNIGASGNSGIRTSGPHLHFELRRGSGANNSSIPFDPMEVF